VGCIQQGKPAEAEALAQQILRDHPNEPNILPVLGVALMRQGKFEEALKHLSTSVNIAPELAGGHEQYGLALAALRRLNEAALCLVAPVQRPLSIPRPSPTR
jgi:Flp pilus assembly protein TadD